MGSGVDGGGHNTSNLRKAAAKSAENRRCEACGRKSAMERITEPGLRYRACRWCGHVDRVRRLPDATG